MSLWSRTQEAKESGNEYLGPNQDRDFIFRVMKVFHFDNTDQLWWRVDDDQLTLFAKCSDTFDWGTADCEEITEQNIDILEQSFDDCTANSAGLIGECFIATLFASRVRKRRPMRMFMEKAEADGASPKLLELLESCGEPNIELY